MPAEAGMLYYGLKEAGIKPMLAWWDGKKFVDLAAASTSSVHISSPTSIQSTSNAPPASAKVCKYWAI